MLRRFLGNGFWGDGFGLSNLLNTPEQILGGTDLAQILGLQMGKFLRHIVGIHVFVAGDQVLCLVGGS